MNSPSVCDSGDATKSQDHRTPDLKIEHSSLFSSPSSSPSPPSSPSNRLFAVRKLVPSTFQLTRTSKLLIFCLILFSLTALAAILDSFAGLREPSCCKQTHMRPQYIKQTGFDSEMTRFAGKYALYLYREKDVDLIDQPTGVPVLFIPGHAGSYKQIRSIAAEAAFQYSHRYARHVENWDHGGRSLDFFTVDFNEEFSALHGQSLLEQAEYLNDAVDYILKLYPQSRKLDPRFSADLPDPTSVIIIGHSMGGVVARTMFTLPNYQPGTINTILTFSTPHLMPPAPFDWKITKIYSDISHYWMNGFKESDWTRSGMALKDVMLISVTGGVLDTMICPDNANVGGFIPQNNGFTVFTTAIPNVWTPTDHDSILSCNQLVKIIAKSLLDIVDARRGPQTRHLVERIGVMRRAFLSGLEDRNADLSLSPLSFYELPDSNVNFLKPQERLVIRADTATGMTFLPVFDNSGKNVFGVLTDMPIDATERFDLLLCNKLESHVVGYTRAGCRSARAIVAPIPASVSKEERQKSNSNFMFANIAFSEMAGYEYLAIVHKEGTNGFLIVEPHDIQETRQSIDKSMLALAIEGAQVDVKPFLFSTIHIPAIENPMLAYHLTISQPPCDNENMFATFLRQSISTMHESKFYLNLTNQGGKTSISIHGRTLFTSTPITGDVDRRGLMLQLWMDPTCPHPATISLSIDWYGSAGRVGFRNGIILAAFSFVIVILVLVAQIQCYNETGMSGISLQCAEFFRLCQVVEQGMGKRQHETTTINAEAFESILLHAINPCPVHYIAAIHIADFVGMDQKPFSALVRPIFVRPQRAGHCTFYTVRRDAHKSSNNVATTPTKVR
ncbi:GPI inositol deacylase [Apophysomyces sp. BC1015]|nr:GPI inositol deacylase [Apophysomyces sp. BC1015]